MIRIGWNLLACLAILIYPSAAFAGYFTVCGTATFWDDLDKRTTSSGSKLTTFQNNNHPLSYLKVEIWDQDGQCQDHFLDCPETDDDILGTDTADSSGDYCFSSIGDLEDIYILTRYQAPGLQVKSSSGSTPVRASYPTLFNFGNGGSGNFDLDFSATCYDNNYNTVRGECDSDSTVFPRFSVEAAYSNILATMRLVNQSVSLSINGHSNTVTGYWPDGPAYSMHESNTRHESRLGI